MGQRVAKGTTHSRCRTGNTVVNAGDRTFLSEYVATSSLASHPYRGPAAFYRCPSIVLPRAPAHVEEEQ